MKYLFFLQFQHFPLDPGALHNSSQDNWTVQQSSLVRKCPHLYTWLYTMHWYCIGQEPFLNIPVKKNNSCAQPREIILRLSTTPHHWQQQTENGKKATVRPEHIATWCGYSYLREKSKRRQLKKSRLQCKSSIKVCFSFCSCF